MGTFGGIAGVPLLGFRSANDFLQLGQVIDWTPCISSMRNKCLQDWLGQGNPLAMIVFRIFQVNLN
jgi:hypothetical protein